MKQIVVFDFDGTLCKIHPHSFDEAGAFCVDRFRTHQHLASPIEQSIELFNMYAEQYSVYIVTARPQSMYEQTMAKINSLALPCAGLIMRDASKQESVVDYKLRVLGELSMSKSIVAVLEDRDEICEAIKARGYFCLKVV